MAAQQPAPSRTASVGPASAGGMNAPASAPAAGSAQNSQQNLNQIVLEYLSKKGYSRTESMLRKESAHVDANGQPILTKIEEKGGRAYAQCFQLAVNWVENVLDIYRPELKRLLWPIFVYGFLQLVSECYPRDAEGFFQQFRERFENEHSDDLRVLAPISTPEHMNENEIAQLYRNNRYRVPLSHIAYATFVQFLESKDEEGGRILLLIVTNYIDIHAVDRAAASGVRGLQKLLAQRNGDEDVPGEDEGIPGHHSGPLNRTTNTQRPDKLRLGHMPMERDLMEDVKADLIHEDSIHPPVGDQPTLVEQFEQSIKVEEDEAPPPIPFPLSTARDVAMEVQRVKENRDRFKIETRSGGVGPGLSVTMFTFHNTFDSVNCIEFSRDNSLVAVGTAESYIRVWSLDNRPLTSNLDPASQQPSSSRRLIGHAGPIYALSFSPAAAIPQPQINGHKDETSTSSSSSTSQPRFLVSSSADGTIRLWSSDTWTNVVVYRAHNSPVWDLRFSPHGHYFISGAADRTARLWSTPQIAPLLIFVGHDSDVDAVAWHPNGAYVFTGSGGGDRTIRMWSIATGTEVRLFSGHMGNITTISCAPSGRMVASADDRGEIILWDLQSARLIKRMRGHGRGGVWSLDWSIESTVLVSGGADRTVRVWDVQHNKDTQSKSAGDGTAGAKTDGAANGTTAMVNKSGKAKKDVVVSADQISAFPTKSSPVYKVHFTQMNLIMAGSVYLP